MHYEINVSKKNSRGEYWHFFATDKRSITTQAELCAVYKKFMEAFPAPEYQMYVTHWEEIGHGVNMDSILKRKEA